MDGCDPIIALLVRTSQTASALPLVSLTPLPIPNLFSVKSQDNNHTSNQTHCPIRVSTRPAWHSKFYAWLFLLWPRLIQNSCWINLKGGAFWENLSSVVTSLDSRKTNWEIIKRTFLLAIRGINVNIVTTTEILIPVQAFLKAFIASYFLFLGDIQCWPNKTQRFYFHQG